MSLYASILAASSSILLLVNTWAVLIPTVNDCRAAAWRVLRWEPTCLHPCRCPQLAPTRGFLLVLDHPWVHLTANESKATQFTQILYQSPALPSWWQSWGGGRGIGTRRKH